VSLRKGAGLLVALGLMAGLIQSGVAAQFTDSVIATQNINVGTMSCVAINPTGGATIVDAHHVSYNAPDILSSAASQSTFGFSVQSVGSVPIDVTVSANTAGLSTRFHDVGIAPAAPQFLTNTQSVAYTGGIKWDELINDDLGRSETLIYTVNCTDAPVGFNVGYYAVNNGGTQFAPGTWVRSTSPIASTVVVSGGTATQSVSGGDVNLAISGNTGYADNGFYVPLGTLSSLASSGYTVTGTGSDFGTNVYFDVNNDGEFFGWTTNYLSSITPDTYGLGPTSSGGTLAVTGSSTFAMTCNGAYGDYSLTTLATGGCSPEGVSGSTKVAVWVGITSTGAALSTTITSAP
jgi:hypothetical protein